jgi:hypothetical protein
MWPGIVKLTENRTNSDDVPGDAEGLSRLMNAGLLSPDTGRAGQPSDRARLLPSSSTMATVQPIPARGLPECPGTETPRREPWGHRAVC